MSISILWIFVEINFYFKSFSLNNLPVYLYIEPSLVDLIFWCRRIYFAYHLRYKIDYYILPPLIQYFEKMLNILYYIFLIKQIFC